MQHGVRALTAAGTARERQFTRISLSACESVERRLWAQQRPLSFEQVLLVTHTTGACYGPVNLYRTAPRALE
jgi:hypothetical protein